MRPFELRDWWVSARSTFSGLLPESAPQIEAEFDRLVRLLQRPEETVLCFLGQSGIGKSTLINALVAEDKAVLPAGGTGPLTAIATQVRYSETPFFRVKYQDARKLRGILLSLEREMARAGQAVMAPIDADPSLLNWQFDDDEESGVTPPIALVPVDNKTPVSDRMRVLLHAARTLVKGAGTDHAEPIELARGLRYALGLEFKGLIEEEDRDRLRDVAEALRFAAKQSSRVVSAGSPGEDFESLLQKHTAGSLAPLVSEIEVGWPSPALAGGVVLVDLPGVGIAGDDYQRATHTFVRQRARGVVMVVKRGVTKDEIDLIKTSGFWERVLLAAGDPEADPCDLIIARTSLDDVVTSELGDRDLDDEQVSALYQRLAIDTAASIRIRAVTELRALTGVDGDDDDLKQARELAANEVLQSLSIYPVSAVDYTKLLRGNRRLPAIATCTEDTGIPQLQSQLAKLGIRNRASLDSLRQGSAQRIADMVNAAIDQEIASLTEGKREREELNRLRCDLARFLEPLRIEYAVRQGQYREFLDSTAPALIGQLVERAQTDARKSASRYLQSLASANWATLKAAVVRGGAFVGSRKIDLPDDIAQLFQEPIAAIWGSKTGLLREVRDRTKGFGITTQVLIEVVLDWAKEWPGSVVSLDGLEPTRRSASALSDQLGQVGTDAADELRRAVRDRLLQVTTPAIQRACRAFVDRGDAAGPGVRARMVEMFGRLADDSVDRAGKVATKLLNEQFAIVRGDISKIFAQWGDPLDRTAAAIAPAEYEGDATKRAERIAQLESLLVQDVQPSETGLAAA